jgi:hypothetical protein
VTASNGLLVNGNLNVNGGVVTYGGTTVDGGTIVGQQFEDTDTSGNSYGLVIKNSGTSNGVPFLSFVQGATVASGFAGGIGGWTKAPAFGYIQGLNLSFYSSYPRIGIRNASAATNIATFDANGLQVTGSVNVSNGVKVAAGGLQVAGNISDGGFKGPIFVDDTVSDGTSDGVVIRNQSASDYAAANISLVQNSTYIGTIGGLNNTPAGTTFGLLGGVNIAALNNKVINFRAYDPGTPANSYSFGKFSSTGLDVTGVVTASLGFSGSLTRLTDGTSYLIAGTNITITTASNGSVTVSSIPNNVVRDRSVSTNFTVDFTTDQFIRVSSAATGTLPNPSTSGSFVIKKTGTGTYTINISGSYGELIDGQTYTSAGFTLTGSSATDRPAWTIWSDGTDWWIA